VRLWKGKRFERMYGESPVAFRQRVLAFHKRLGSETKRCSTLSGRRRRSAKALAGSQALASKVGVTSTRAATMRGERHEGQ
jgi:hypothetical protein